ncbi:MAG TPA: hypothetical protein VN612_04025 [Acidobacteriaceae bacterium]|nr:hypothetical protein [Acidobacteriaceae bacterium]
MAIWPSLLSAQRSSSTPPKKTTIQPGACEAEKRSLAAFTGDMSNAAFIAKLHQEWTMYQNQRKLKQVGLQEDLCLAEWEEGIFSMPANVIEAAKIPIQPDSLWVDIVTTATLIKRAIPAYRAKGRIDDADSLQMQLDNLQNYLTSQDSNHTVLPSFIKVRMTAGKEHRLTASELDGIWPAFTVENRAMTLALTNVSLTCIVTDASQQVVWKSVVSIPRIPPLQSVTVQGDGDMIKMTNNSEIFLQQPKDVDFEIQPTTDAGEIERSIQNLGK